MNLSPRVFLQRDWFSILCAVSSKLNKNRASPHPLFRTVTATQRQALWFFSENQGYFSSLIYRCENVCSTNEVISCFWRLPFTHKARPNNWKYSQLLGFPSDQNSECLFCFFLFLQKYWQGAAIYLLPSLRRDSVLPSMFPLANGVPLDGKSGKYSLR